MRGRSRQWRSLWIAWAAAIATLAAGGTPAAEAAGTKPELKLHPRVTIAWRRYNKLWNPMYFAVSEDGLRAGYVSCQGSSAECSEREGRQAALRLCNKHSKTSPCFLFARGKQVLWKGTVAHASVEEFAVLLPNRAKILENFGVIAFRHELADQDNSFPLIRWREPVRIAVLGEEAGRYRSAVSRFASELARITAHEIGMMGADGKSDDSANVRVYFTRDIFEDVIGRYREEVTAFLHGRGETKASVREMRKRRVRCFVKLVLRPPEFHDIGRAVIFIPSTLSQSHTQECIVEELSQMLGLMNDSDDVNPSIFNDSSPFRELTAQDTLLLRVLYDERLRTGMSWQEAEPIAKEIIAELTADAD